VLRKSENRAFIVFIVRFFEKIYNGTKIKVHRLSLCFKLQINPYQQNSRSPKESICFFPFLNTASIKFNCISSKENLAHEIARGAHEEKETIEISIPLYELSHKAFISYQRETKNMNCSKQISQRKLTRNIMLSKKAKEESGVILYRYGNLNIYVEDNNIVRLEKGTFSNGFKKSKNEYRRLNKLLYL
jgi:hypothetical protein